MKITAREMILISLFAALTAIGAFISIPIGNIPLTLQSFFTLLSGILLGSRLGSLSQLIYVLLGLSGARIFANFTGGPQTIFTPNFGFLIGFIIAAYVVGWISHYNGKPSFKRILFATFIGTLIIYSFGLPYMHILLNKIMGQNFTLVQTLKAGCLIFLPGDIFKAIISSSIAFKIKKRMPSIS